MATVKTIRLRSDRAAWLQAEAERAGVSQSRIVEELVTGAMEDKWQFGKPRYILEAHIERKLP